MRATIAGLRRGQEVSISLAKRSYNSIRNCASLLGGDLGRKYTVQVSRTDNVCKVTRVE